MYLLYVDESGRPKPGADSHLVVAGLAIHEEDCYPLAQSLRTLERRYVGAAKADALELHATDIWGGRGDWAKVSGTSRRSLVRSVFRHLGRWKAPSGRAPTYFAAVVHKNSFPASAVERAHEELFARFDEFIGRLHHAGDSHRSLVIADDSSYESLLQTLAPQWKRGQSRLGKLHSFAEVPLYVNSRASRCVQAADFVAWGTWQYYENGHTEHLQKLNARFDALDGIQHGLVHLHRRYRTCLCVPCESRRTKVVKDRLAPSPRRV